MELTTGQLNGHLWMPSKFPDLDISRQGAAWGEGGPPKLTPNGWIASLTWSKS